MIRPAGGDDDGQAVLTGTTLDTSRIASDQDVSIVRAPSRHDDVGQPSPMGHLYSMGKNACSTQTSARHGTRPRV